MVIFLCPYLVTGDASLRGIEYNFIPTERIDTPRFESHNHHEEPVQITTTSHHNIVVPTSTSPIEKEISYNDVEYESDSYEPASSTDYYPQLLHKLLLHQKRLLQVTIRQCQTKEIHNNQNKIILLYFI